MGWQHESTKDVIMSQLLVNRLPSVSEQFANIYNLVEQDINRVRSSLNDIIVPETQLLADTINHSVQSQGKLLRPVLMMLLAGASGTVQTAHIETAAVAELIHVATLLHDDVLDESDVRRGQPTVRSQWGNKVSILSGDYLLAQASLKLSKLNNCRLVSIFAKVLCSLCEGEVEQIRISFNIETDWDSYFHKTLCKTADLFAACGESAGVINTLPEEQIILLRQFGEKFGIAFQIIDDLLDYTGSTENLGKPILGDLKAGILNAPVLIALESYESGSSDHQDLKQLIEQVFSDQEGRYNASLLAALESVQAIDKTYALAERYAQEARDCIAFLPDNDYKRALITLLDCSIRRQN